MKPASQGGLRVHAAKLNVWCLRPFTSLIHSPFSLTLPQPPQPTLPSAIGGAPRRKKGSPPAGAADLTLPGPPRQRGSLSGAFSLASLRACPCRASQCHLQWASRGCRSPSALGCTPGTPGTLQSCLFSPVACHHQLLSVPSRFTADIWTCTQQEPFRDCKTRRAVSLGKAGILCRRPPPYQNH